MARVEVRGLVKKYGASFDPYLRPITKPVAGTVKVADTGIHWSEPRDLPELERRV